MTTIQLLSVIFAISTTVYATNPGVRIQSNQALLDYAKGIGMTVLNKQVQGLSIPNFNGDSGILQYSVTNIKLSTFNAPSSGASVNLQPPNNVALSVGGVSAYVTGDYEIKVGSGWFSISKSGWVSASTSGTSLSTTLGVTQGGGKPQLSASGCSAHINNLNVQFHGDLVDQIIDLFSNLISGYVAGQLNSVICSQLESVISNQANGYLRQIPTSINIADGFNIDYSLTGNPMVSNGAITVPMLGEIWFNGHHNDPGIPQAQPMNPVSSNQELCIEADAEAVIGSAGYAAQVSGGLTFTVDQAMLQQYHVPFTMACSCGGGLCIGSFIPQIASKCPAGGSVSIQMFSTNAPTAYVNSTGAFLTFAGDLNFIGNVNGGQVPLFSAHITLGTVIPSTLQFQGWKIQGEIQVTNATLNVLSSDIGPIDQAGLEQLWQLGIMAIISGELNKVTEAGIPLPAIPDLTIQSPVLSFGPHTLTVCANVIYTGPTY